MNHGKLKFIGSPCKRNPDHAGLRYIAGRNCVECEIEETWDMPAAQKFSWVGEGVMRDAFTASFDNLLQVPPPFVDARSNRAKARLAFHEEQPYFQGSPCNECACTLRFTSTTGCVACQRLGMATDHREGGLTFPNPSQAVDFVAGRFVPILTLHRDRQVRNVAASLGLAGYTGAPCKHCGTSERYTSRGQCVSCVKQRNDARSAKKKTAPARTEAAEFDYLFE